MSTSIRPSRKPPRSACRPSTARTRSRSASCCTRTSTITHAELREFLAARMPDFMLPRYIEFVEEPERTEAMKRIKKPPLRVDPLNENTWDALAPAPSAK